MLVEYIAAGGASPRFQRLVQRLHDLGPRPTGEFVIELGREHRIPLEAIEANLETYAKLDPALLRALRGDRFPPGAPWPVPAYLGATAT